VNKLSAVIIEVLKRGFENSVENFDHWTEEKIMDCDMIESFFTRISSNLHHKSALSPAKSNKP
jgi:hypothetical protein